MPTPASIRRTKHITLKERFAAVGMEFVSVSTVDGEHLGYRITSNKTRIHFDRVIDMVKAMRILEAHEAKLVEAA